MRKLGGIVRALHVFEERLTNIDRRSDEFDLFQIALGQTSQREDDKCRPHRDGAPQGVGWREQFDIAEFDLMFDLAQLVRHRSERNIPQSRVHLQTQGGQSARKSVGLHLQLDQVERFDHQGRARLLHRRRVVVGHQTLQTDPCNHPSLFHPQTGHTSLLQACEVEFQLGTPRAEHR